MQQTEPSTIKDVLLVVNPYISSFIALLAGYFFAYRGKLADRELNRNYELNTILSNLMQSWFYVKRLHIAYTRLPSIMEEARYDGFPVVLLLKILAIFIKKLDSSCLTEVETSIKGIKKYDPAVYFRHSDTGNKANYFRSLSSFFAFAETEETRESILFALEQSLEDIKESIDDIASLLTKKESVKIKRALDLIYFDETSQYKFFEGFTNFKTTYLANLNGLLAVFPEEQRAQMYADIADDPRFEEAINMMFDDPEKAGLEFRKANSQLADLQRA